MPRLSILTILILGALLIPRNQCIDHFDKLTENERSRIRGSVTDLMRLLLARNPTHESETFIGDLISTSELRAYNRHILQLVTLSSPKNVLSEKCFTDGDSCFYHRYFSDHKDLFLNMFESQLSSGLVKSWPRYVYNQEDQTIKVLPEEISFVSQANDFGPSLPVLEKPWNSTLRVFENDVKWIPRTPQGLKNPDYYQLNHVVPLSQLSRFYEILHATWRAIGNRERQMLSARFRVIKRISESTKLVAFALEFGSGNVTNKFEERKKHLSEAFRFDNDLKNNLLWAPGNLCYGFKDQIKSDEYSEDALDSRTEVIVGSERFRKAHSIYNRILDFINRVNCTEPEKIAQKIKSDQSLFTEMKEILSEFMDFGLERDKPYPNNWLKWNQNPVTKQWELKDLEANYTRNEIDKVDERLSVSATIDNHCNVSSGVNRFVEIDLEYMKFEDFQVRSILTNRTDAIFVLKNFAEKFPELKDSTSLSELADFVRDESFRYFYYGQCEDKNLVCSKVNALCHYKDIRLSCEENSEPVDQFCPDIVMEKQRYIRSVSFTDWCNGRRFVNKNELTTDSAAIRVLSFNMTKQNSLNKKVYYNLFDEYRISDYYDKVDFLEFVEDQLQEFNTTASRILNQACEIYRKPVDVKKNEVKLAEGDWKSGVCPPTTLLAAYYCVFEYAFPKVFPEYLVAFG